MAIQIPFAWLDILDVAEDEARALLLSIDPLAALAQTQDQIHQRLLELAPPVPADLQAAWHQTAEAAMNAAAPHPDPPAALAAQYLVVVTCRDEPQQVDLLQRLTTEGLPCKALLS